MCHKLVVLISTFTTDSTVSSPRMFNLSGLRLFQQHVYQFEYDAFSIVAEVFLVLQA
jgi:hypothetical protein